MSISLQSMRKKWVKNLLYRAYLKIELVYNIKRNLQEVVIRPNVDTVGPVGGCGCHLTLVQCALFNSCLLGLDLGHYPSSLVSHARSPRFCQNSIFSSPMSDRAFHAFFLLTAVVPNFFD